MFHAGSVQIQQAEHVLPLGVSLVRRKAGVFRGFLIGFFHALAVEKHIRQPHLGVDVSLVRGQAEVFRGLLQGLLRTVAEVVMAGDDVLGVRVSLLRADHEITEGRFIVLISERLLRKLFPVRRLRRGGCRADSQQRGKNQAHPFPHGFPHHCSP